MYGAVDFYYNDIISKLAEKYLTGSIMNRKGMVVDSLTAHLVGWIPLTSEAEEFLEELSAEFSAQELKDSYLLFKKNSAENSMIESITGQVTDHKMHNGTYTGNLENGTPQGYGKMIDSDGIIYEGNWKDGLPDGHGKMIWNDGNIYEGNWKDGFPDGHGRMIFSDGSVAEGEWDMGALN